MNERKTFKDFAAADIRSIFLNTNEFADVHMIDRKEMHVIAEISDDKHPFSHAEGITLSSIILHVNAAELGYKPREGNGSITTARGFKLLG